MEVFTWTKILLGDSACIVLPLLISFALFWTLVESWGVWPFGFDWKKAYKCVLPLSEGCLFFSLLAVSLVKVGGTQIIFLEQSFNYPYQGLSCCVVILYSLLYPGSPTLTILTNWTIKGKAITMRTKVVKDLIGKTASFSPWRVHFYVTASPVESFTSVCSCFVQTGQNAI